MDFQRITESISKKPVLIALLALGAFSQQGPRFYADDPVCCALRPLNIPELPNRKTDMLFDFFYNSFAPRSSESVPARGVNTLGEVVDSEWFTNRHGRRHMTSEELRRGPGQGHPPKPPYTVIGGKLDGVTPGFRMRDSKGDLYFVKPDPLSNPEMSTGADVMGSHFFYALGYNTPQNYIVNVRVDEIGVDENKTTENHTSGPRPIRKRDVDKVLWKVPKNKDGTLRLLASLAVPGTPVGPFRYESTRSDDPNDVIPHEDRRDLRALYVFCAWLNHTDAKSINSLDVMVKENGIRFVKHYLIDFGAILGSDSDMAKNARFGFQYTLPDYQDALRDMTTLGFNPKPFETADSPKLPGLGRFLAEPFDPEKWFSNYPNPAFLRRRPDDEYWAAKQVMAFRDEDIRLLVETGQYSDARTVEFLVRALASRRDAIGRTFFLKVLSLDAFRFEKESIAFDDLAVKYGFAPARSYAFAWNRFDNMTGALSVIAGAATAALPTEWNSLSRGEYLAVLIRASGDDRKIVTVFVRKSPIGAPEVVGVERTW